MDLIQIVEMCAKLWIGEQILGFIISTITIIITIAIIVKKFLTK